MSIKNQTTFSKEGYKRIKCTNCWHFLGYQRLGQTEDRVAICSYCGAYNPITIPQIIKKDGLTGVSFGPDNSCWTATPELDN